ncbi:energy-coupling factor transport system substrate-specific component [Pullulanibacillus pueri]|uniref:Putative HMP/thiamine permease protein YkoE n=1 Tax=Pullulanibacillus pueri TaxID=1437324 RepID=A0A8J2ZYX2_9BACL|nr:ECF transporter S component [Pullulanibacillus pueri]MBM7683451.1 energy-coupling factor transport system substrate-specific component [Pullulanibacillus pueri]GGH87444.1 putative HMP/thiamine permease protein YkoE [Pullulanibacillus pueri]
MNWRMKEIVLTVILSILCGVIYLGWSTLWLPLSAIFGPVSSEWMFGIWVIASPLVAYIIQKPGAAMIAEFAASAVEVLTGSQFGLSSFLIGLVQGLGAELVFFCFSYKRYTLLTLMLCGVGGALGSMIYDLMANGFSYYTKGVLLTTFGLRIISGAILGGWLAKGLAEALAKTGVLNAYTLMKERYHGNDTNDDEDTLPRL